ncbi:MAG: helix-turn-helix transcriptional regulator [Bacteroidaceae bacterium]|nr:helix-turn-helix transcriptional regulator [Bacteroidaceae bacterium]
MALLHPESRLCDAILHETTLIPVIARFGITLGLGEKSIATVCQESNLDTDFFVTILNTYINENYFPEKRLQSFCIEQIIDYLTKTNNYYQRVQLPNIERHFSRLVELSRDKENNVELVYNFFKTVRNELQARIESDAGEWFPQLRACAMQCSEQEVQIGGLINESIENDTVEEKLNDLLNLMVKHLTGSYDINLCHAVIFALTSLRDDVVQHNRIRNRILRPVAIRMNGATSQS